MFINTIKYKAKSKEEFLLNNDRIKIFRCSGNFPSLNYELRDAYYYKSTLK